MTDKEKMDMEEDDTPLQEEPTFEDGGTSTVARPAEDPVVTEPEPSYELAAEEAEAPEEPEAVAEEAEAPTFEERFAAETPAEEAPVEDIPTEETPEEGSPVEVEEPAAEQYEEPETPAEEVPTQEMSAEEPALETPSAPTPIGAYLHRSEAEDPQETEQPVPEPKPEKTYTKEELKLRRKYKMDKDPLLSSNDVIPGFVLARGESVIRMYNCLASSKGEGTICLTNKRLLVNADERSEVTIEQVSGIKFSRFSRFYFFKFLFALIFTGIAVFSLLLPLVDMKFAIPNITGDSRQTWAVVLCFVGAGLALILSLPLWFHLVSKTFYFYIFARQDTPFIACKNAEFSKKEAKGKVSASMVVSAGKESEKAARELGALIIEIKEGRFSEE